MGERILTMVAVSLAVWIGTLGRSGFYCSRHTATKLAITGCRSDRFFATVAPVTRCETLHVVRGDTESGVDHIEPGEDLVGHEPVRKVRPRARHDLDQAPARLEAQ